MPEGAASSPFASDWILSERRPLRKTRAIQTRLTPLNHNNLDESICADKDKDNDSLLGRSPRRVTRTSSSTSTSSSISSSPKQSILAFAMNKDTTKTSIQALQFASASSSSSGRSGNNQGKSKDRDLLREAAGSEGEDSGAHAAKTECMAAIKEKVANFQQKIDSLLPRVLDRTSATAPTVATGPLSKTARTEQGSSGGKGAKPGASKPTTASTSPATVTTVATAGKSGAKLLVAATGGQGSIETVSTSKSRSKKSQGSPATSIATLIPKGSRAKPLPPQKTAESATTHVTATAMSAKRETRLGPHQSERSRTGDHVDKAIVLSSSIPSSPSSPMEENDLDEDMNMDVDNETHEKEAEVEMHAELEKQAYTTMTNANNVLFHNQDNAGAHDEVRTGTWAAPITNTTTITAAATATARKIPSIISVDSSSRSYDFSSIPSVQVERIANWMGGVKEAMEQDRDGEVQGRQSRTRVPQPEVAHVQPISAVVATTDLASKSKNDSLGSKETMETKRPVLRQPPPGIPRHVGLMVAAATDNSPQVSPDYVASSLGEENLVLATTAPTERPVNRSKRVFVKDSIPSLPPVPLFHETSDVSERQGEGQGYIKATTTTSESAAAAAVVGTVPLVTLEKGQYQDDDLSTVVGQQTTQDSFMAGHSSLPSFLYDKDQDDEDEEEEAEKEEAYYAKVRQELTQKEPSLPSGLTSSCLQELGLVKRKRGDDEGGGGKKRDPRGGLSPTGEGDEAQLEDEENEEDSIILAQREAFPASIGAAPASSSPSPSPPPSSLASSSFSVLEAPEFTHAFPNRIRLSDRDLSRTQNRTQTQTQSQSQVEEAPSWSRLQPGQQLPESGLWPDLSLPSPPPMTSFSTLPTMPSMPSFPSLLPDESSRLCQDEADPGSSQSQDQTQDQTQDLNLDADLDIDTVEWSMQHRQHQQQSGQRSARERRYQDSSFPSPPSQMSFSTFPTMPTFPASSTLDDTYINSNSNSNDNSNNSPRDLPSLIVLESQSQELEMAGEDEPDS